jgi:hypothetical protein
MKTIGYMLNTYDEHGPEDIAVFPPEADLPASLIEYCSAAKMSFTYEAVELSKWLDNIDRKKNEAHDLSDGWGGVQITELAVK